MMKANNAICRFEWDPTDRRFKIVMEHSYRIIILDERGTWLGNIEIPFRIRKRTSETITHFDAYVYNKQGNKISRERIKQSSGIREKTSDNYNTLKFALPNVRPGSVIEVRYRLHSFFLENLRPWRFQDFFPVEYSAFELRLPNVFRYRRFSRGIARFQESASSSTETMSIQLEESRANMLQKTERLVTFSTTNFKWVARDVPPFVNEPFTDNPINYFSFIRFEYFGEEWPNSPPRYIAHTWEDVSRTIYKDEDFGGFLNNAYIEAYNHFPIINPEDEFFKKVDQALEAIRTKLRWNGSTSWWASRSAAEVLETGQGNSAEINLLLCALLQNTGLDAQPVLLSTRDNGAIQYESPSLFQFDYILVAVKDDDDKMVLLDATDPDLPAGVIPQRAVNGQGRRISKDTSSWVVLENPGMIHQKKIYSLSLQKDGSLNGEFQFQHLSLGKHFMQARLKEMGQQAVFSSLEKELKTKILEPTVVIPQDPDMPLIISGKINFADFAAPIAGEWYLQPLLFETLTSHDFRSEDRQFPLFFENRSLSEIEMNIHLPEGIQVGKLPSNQIIRWGNNLIYDYNASAEDGILNLSAKTMIAVQRVEPRFYPNVRDFYTRSINKNLEQIILK